MFKPLYMVPGSIILLVMVLPWHIIMYQSYGYEFIKQYFIMHHFRKIFELWNYRTRQTFIVFCPCVPVRIYAWTIIFIASLADGIKNSLLNTKREGKVMTKLQACLMYKQMSKRCCCSLQYILQLYLLCLAFQVLSCLLLYITIILPLHF